MKLFELFDQHAQQGYVNIKKIQESARTNKSAVILTGTEVTVLESTQAKEILAIYEQAVLNGRGDLFVAALSKTLKEHYSLDSIEKRFPAEVKEFMNSGEMSEDLFHALYDYYFDEMPYGTKKARDGDPYEWVSDRFWQEYSQELAQESMFESRADNWNKMLAAGEKAHKEKAGTGKFDKKSTSTGTVYTRKYNSETGETETPPTDGEGNDLERRGRGRPRKHPKPDENAPKRGRGRPRTKPLPDPDAPKRGRGRPKKVQEWIESLAKLAKI